MGAGQEKAYDRTGRNTGSSRLALRKNRLSERIRGGDRKRYEEIVDAVFAKEWGSLRITVVPWRVTKRRKKKEYSRNGGYTKSSIEPENYLSREKVVTFWVERLH